LYATGATSDTKTTCNEVAVSRDEFKPGELIITELRPGTIRRTGETQGYNYVQLTLPYGFHWVDNFTKRGTDSLDVGVMPGLSWYDGSTGTIGEFTSNPASGPLTTGDKNERYWSAFFGNGGTANDKLTGAGSTTTIDDSVLVFWFPDSLKSSTQIAGKLYLRNLYFYADDDAPIPTGDSAYDIKIRVKGDYITEEDIVIGQRRDWNLGLKTTNTVPTLVSGRYIGPSWSGNDADNNTHRTARVQLYENTANSWWGSRTVVLSLPATDNNKVKGAKFRKIQVTEADKVTVETTIKDTRWEFPYYGVAAADVDKGVYLNDGQKHGYIMVDDNKITLSNISLDTTGKATIDFDLWVSLELGFGAQSGDLKLAIDPSSTAIAGVIDVNNLPSVVIAHVVDPIKVNTKISDLKIGYQYQATSDIQITENGPGYLLKDKTVRVSITDLISSDMWFTPTTTVQVTAGDLKLKNLVTNGAGGFTSQSSSWLPGVSGSDATNDSLAFDIDRPSTTASTITIANIGVKLDRTIPVTNQSAYQALVWGTAIAENYGLKDKDGRTWKADFNTAGVSVPYINVITSATDEASILTQEVQVPIGESYFVVNGVSYTMDAAAYISPASHSTMVPVRFVANAFGLRNDNQIIWDGINKTATIIAPNRTIQFTAAKSVMIVNGVSVTMTSPDGLPVVAEIKGDDGHERMYIPFRALGEAFGIPVDWDAETQTAIYNKGANTNLNLPVSNTNTVQ
jgi:hypothetical protein